MSYKVYMHVSPSGKVYIGITKNSLKKRWNAGRGYLKSTKFGYAIQKYGWDNIEHRLLFDNLSELDAKMIEEDLIWYYKKIGKSYNITDGGDGGKGVKMSDTTKKKLSIANTGRLHSDETKEKIRKARTGIKFSDEHRHNLSVAHKGQGGKAVIEITTDGIVLNKYPSILEAAIANNVPRTTLNNRIKRGSVINNIRWVYEEN